MTLFDTVFSPTPVRGPENKDFPLKQRRQAAALPFRSMTSVMLLLLLLLVLLAGCGRERPVAVPRPLAWPRVATYSAAYHAEEAFGGRLTLMVNDSARVTHPAEMWADIIYPAYGLTVNATLTPFGPGVMENRSERMALNLGGASAELTRLTTPGGWHATLVSAPSAGLTPLQFLATDSARYVLSGTVTPAYDSTAPVDSVMPLLRALEADLIHMLKEL